MKQQLVLSERSISFFWKSNLLFLGVGFAPENWKLKLHFLALLRDGSLLFCSRRSFLKRAKRTICYFLSKNEQFAQKTKEQIPKAEFFCPLLESLAKEGFKLCNTVKTKTQYEKTHTHVYWEAYCITITGLPRTGQFGSTPRPGPLGSCIRPPNIDTPSITPVRTLL